MSRFVEVRNLSDLEDKVDELYDSFNHVEFVGWRSQNTAEFYCV